MPDFNGIKTEIVGPMEHEESGDVLDLYVNYEGLQALRDNTTRPYSEFFDGLLKQVDSRLAEYEADKIEQDPLPGL
jgi:hypothetical protein